MKLREFSKLIGLSTTTVSRALSGYPEVKPETRKRIREAALKLGYHPNRSAAGLATGRAGAIGIVFPNEHGFEPLTTEFLGGLAGRLEHDGIDVLVSGAASRESELATYTRLAASRRVDALVIHSPTLKDERIPFLEKLGMPFIVHGRTEVSGNYPFVDIDNFSAAKRATSHLLDLGHRRIAIINCVKGRTFVEHREQGLIAAFSERGLQADPMLFGNDQFTDELGYKFMQRFLENSNPPTAVLAGSMMSAFGATRAIRSAGMMLGRDISLIAHDDVFSYLNAENMVPALTTTRSSIRAAGSRVAEFVLLLLSGKKPEELQEVWSTELVLRESTGVASHSAVGAAAFTS